MELYSYLFGAVCLQKAMGWGIQENLAVGGIVGDNDPFGLGPGRHFLENPRGALAAVGLFG